MAPLCRIANKNKTSAFNFINALVKVCKASKQIAKNKSDQQNQMKKASDNASSCITPNDNVSNNCSEFKDFSCEISNFHTNLTTDNVSEGGTEMNMLMKGHSYSGIFS